MNGVSFRRRAVHLDATATLVVADLHVGRDEISGVAFPLGERADLAERLHGLLAHFEPSEVVVAGDVLHGFDRASDRPAAAAVDGLIDRCRAAGARPVLVAGDRDAALGSVWDGPVEDAHRVGEGTVVCHGHEIPDERDADRYLIGHDHPTVSIGGRRRPCYLYGPEQFRGADVLMLPAFNRLLAGVEVNGMGTDDYRSPLITDADGLRPVVYDEGSHETLAFPPLGECRRLL